MKTCHLGLHRDSFHRFTRSRSNDLVNVPNRRFHNRESMKFLRLSATWQWARARNEIAKKERESFAVLRSNELDTGESSGRCEPRARVSNRNLRFPPTEPMLLITKCLALNFVERPPQPLFQSLLCGLRNFTPESANHEQNGRKTILFLQCYTQTKC